MALLKYSLVWLLDTLDRKDWRDSPLPDTLRWFNTAGALLVGANHMDPKYLGGVQPEETARVCQKLEQWWEITDHDSALETMSELLSNGMRASLNRHMELFSIYRQQLISKGAVDQAAIKKRPSNNDRLLPRWLEQQEKTFLGWDLCRAICITNWCYACGYLNFSEMMEISVTAGQMLQQEFSDWDEVMASYLTGLFAWMDPSTKEDWCSFKLRRHLYKILRSSKGPFASIPFHTTLSKTLTEAEEAALHHI